jgi:hypothetical protein
MVPNVSTMAELADADSVGTKWCLIDRSIADLEADIEIDLSTF